MIFIPPYLALIFLKMTTFSVKVPDTPDSALPFYNATSKMHLQFKCLACLDEVCSTTEDGIHIKCEKKWDPFYTGNLEKMKDEMEYLNENAYKTLDDYNKAEAKILKLQKDGTQLGDDNMKEMLLQAKFAQKAKFFLLHCLARRDQYQELILKEFGILHICKKHVKFAK
jgi:hypothetical protein